MILRTSVIVLLFLLPLYSVAEDAAAVVAKYLPPKAEPIIVRADGEQSTAGLGTPLYAGDTVKVADGGSLVVAYADGERDTLEGPTTFSVPEKAPMGMAAKIYDRLQVMLGRQYRQGANLATRNPGDCKNAALVLDAPVLRDTTYLSVGHENVALAWVGGCAPYSLSLDGAEANRVRQDGLKRPLTRFDGRGLAAGDYTLTLRDAQAQVITVTVTLGELPAGPMDHVAIQTELEAVAYAAWLANYDGGSWRLESFQQLRPWIRDGGVMAGTFGDLVMWGDPSLDLDATN